MTTSLVTPGTEIGTVGEHQAGEGTTTVDNRIVAHVERDASVVCRADQQVRTACRNLTINKQVIVKASVIVQRYRDIAA